MTNRGPDDDSDGPDLALGQNAAPIALCLRRAASLKTVVGSCAGRRGHEFGADGIGDFFAENAVDLGFGGAVKRPC
jgi:hypothetical protein